MKRRTPGHSKTPRDGSQTRKVLAFIRAEIAAGRGFPSCNTIGAFMGWKGSGGAAECLRRLYIWGELIEVAYGAPAHLRYELRHPAAAAEPASGEGVNSTERQQGRASIGEE